MNQSKTDDTQVIIESIKSLVKSYPDFPKPGIVFRDIFPLFQNPKLLDQGISILINHIKNVHPNVNTIIGLESRGFLIGPLIALRLKVPFIPIRKAGKLPGKVKSISYSLEYGSDRFEIQDSLKNEDNCIIIDDLLATGGSVESAIKLIKQCQANVLEVLVMIELVDLKGRERYSEPTFSLIQFD